MKRTTAPNSSGGAYVDRIPGVQLGTTLVAEDSMNWQEEICHPIELLGQALNGADHYQLEKAIIGIGRGKPGDLVFSEIARTPITYSAARNDGNPTGPEYDPIIPRHDADHDVSDAQAPDLVTALRAQKITIAGTQDFSIASVVGNRITLANNATNDLMLAKLVAAGIVSRWFSSGKIATFAAGGAHYAYAPRQMCVTVNNVEYAIIDVNQVSRYIDVTGSPASVATCSIYPYRIAGSATSIRLRCLSGFSLVALGSDDADPALGVAEMDRAQGHRHTTPWYQAPLANQNLGDNDLYGSEAVAGTNYVTGVSGATYGSRYRPYTGDAKTDGNNGIPRTGKTTNTRQAGIHVYTFARTLLATNWT